MEPKKLADWAFHNSRPILLPLDTDFNAEYARDQEDYEFTLVFVDRADDYSQQVEPLLTEACHQHSKAVLCVRATQESEYFAMSVGITRAR